MNKPRVLLLGAGGQLGRTLQQFWQEHGDLPWELLAYDRATLDICSPRALDQVLADQDPRWVINAAAYTQVDKAESEQDRAYGINGQGAENVARWLAGRSGRMLQVSTDFVFSGSSSEPYRPDSQPDPLSVYGASKLNGEQAVQRVLGDRATILRTGWVYSAFGQNFLLTILRLLRERDTLNIVADQTGTPTATISLASLIPRILSSDSGGIFHWSDRGKASWYDFAVAIQDEALSLGLLHIRKPIHAIETSQYPTAARRPAYSVLDKSSSCATFACEPVGWRDQLRRVLMAMRTVQQHTH